VNAWLSTYLETIVGPKMRIRLHYFILFQKNQNNKTSDNIRVTGGIGLMVRTYVKDKVMKMSETLYWVLKDKEELLGLRSMIFRLSLLLA
jgi:hypothetical protein